MAAARFFFEGDLAAGARVRLPDAVAHHARRVLRLRTNDVITLFNGRGGEFTARIGAAADVQIDQFDPVERESPLELTLIQALVANDKLDWVIEKAVELGVARIIIAATARSVIRLEHGRVDRRRAHWRDVAIGACCQCGRNRLPALQFEASFAVALAAVADVPQRFILAPDAATGVAAAVRMPTAIAVGPEGGFTDAESRLAARSGFARLRWSPRVLRTETAGLAVLAALQTLLGDGAQSGAPESRNGARDA
jgi:16S rRNA (uracil1498-N3)-methyltransferase